MKNPARESYQLFINGKWVDSSDGGAFQSFSPANDELLSTCAEAPSGFYLAQ